MLLQNAGDVYDELHEIWAKNAERLPDEMREPAILDYFLFDDGGATRFYVVDGQAALVMVGDIKEGLSATVMPLNHDYADVGSMLHELREIIDEFSLRRLTAQVPAPVKDLKKALEQIGFRREGHLRRSTFWNGRLVGMDIYGLYRDPPRDGRYQQIPGIDSRQ